MKEIEWLRSHVERCLEDSWDVPRAVADDDGDYPYRWGTAACFVRIEAGEPPMVRVWARAASGVGPTARLLRELNVLNASARTAHLFLADGAVVVEQALHSAGVDRDTLGQACTAVGSVADDVGAMIAAVFGGSTPFPVQGESLDEEAC